MSAKRRIRRPSRPNTHSCVIGGHGEKESWLDDLYPGSQAWWLHEGTMLRYRHLDLAEMTRADLQREQERLNMRLVADPQPDPWLLERREVLAAALQGVRR